MLTDNILSTIGHSRRHFLELTAQCSPEEMNLVPKGFGNNLIWNLAHVVASQQIICYELSGLPLQVEESFINAYKPSSAPGAFVGQDEITVIRGIVASTATQMAEDYRSGLFKTYQGRQTKFGVLLSDIDEAIAYISTHETLHFGYAKAMLRTLRSVSH